MNPSLSAPSETSEQHPLRRMFHARVVAPVVHLLQMGATPERLAWSLAVGAVIGLNPIVGSTTLVCLLIAFIFRLNLIASQITNHLCFPLQLALVVLYLRAGEVLFHTGPPPIPAGAMLHHMRRHPWPTLHMMWTWEWHALVVWLVAAAVLTPLLAAIFRHPLQRLLARMHRSEAECGV